MKKELIFNLWNSHQNYLGNQSSELQNINYPELIANLFLSFFHICALALGSVNTVHKTIVSICEKCSFFICNVLIYSANKDKNNFATNKTLFATK
jgi:hypothetical protein